MATKALPAVPMGALAADDAALQHKSWRKHLDLSSAPAHAELFLENAPFERAPWLAVGLAFGIAAWFALGTWWEWLALLAGLAGCVTLTLAALPADGSFPFLRKAVLSMAAVLALGAGAAWTKSEVVGTAPIARAWVGTVAGRITAVEPQPAEERVRLTVATHLPDRAEAVKVRINVPLDKAPQGLRENATMSVKARLMPPAPPMLPGGYDFARAAWFSGLAATGSAIGPVAVTGTGGDGGVLARLRHALARHVEAQVAGSAGGIAAAFASGERGAIAQSDEDAMRDAGLTHLLSISGLHVSAVIAASYFLAIRLLALWPWFALRVRLPLVAAGAGAVAGVGYTLLTGAEVPTVRSCLGALLVLAALALGREPLSLRMLALAAAAVMLAWPEAVIGPSFQMSFASVLAIVALHGAAPMRKFTAARDEPWWAKTLRNLAALLLTGVVIELALMPIGLFHFHRAGVYGALANVIAIPLTTFVSMPLIALALLFDAVGLGAPFWWLAGKSLEFLLALARWTAAQPGAVTMFPTMGRGLFLLFVGGGLWLALWRGRVRLWGLIPAAVSALGLAFLSPPDVLVSGDGRHVGVIEDGGRTLLMLRDERSDYTRDNLAEVAGMRGDPVLLETWPGARCNDDFCAVTLVRDGRATKLLLSRGKDYVPWKTLAAACAQADIVVADRMLPRSCAPRWLKADRMLLSRTGGLAIDLTRRQVDTVAAGQGAHGWWRGAPPMPGRFAPRKTQ